jgi:hypothetical protein
VSRLVAWVHGAATLAEDRFVTSLHDHDAGVLAFAPHVGIERTATLARDILLADGVNPTLMGWGRNADEDWAILPARLRRLTDVVAVHAEVLQPRVLEALILLAHQIDARLWLVTRPPMATRQADYVRTWAPEVVAPAEFEAAWACRAAPVEAAEAAASDDNGFPRVPRTEFTLFRATCRDVLAAADFELVDAVFRVALAAALALPAIDHGSLARFLGSRYDACSSIDEIVTVTRATQAALLRRGAYLLADVVKLVASGQGSPRSGVADPAMWARLRAYREPHRGAACALSALRLSVADMLALRVDAVRPDGSAVRVAGEDRVVPAPAREYLAVQARMRRLEGAGDEEPFMATLRVPLRARPIAMALAHAARELGLAIAPRQAGRDPGRGAVWLRRHGMILEAL